MPYTSPKEDTMTINVRAYTLTTINGAEIGTFTNLNELGRAFVAHFGKGYVGLADKLVADLAAGKDTSRTEFVLGVKVTSEFVALAA